MTTIITCDTVFDTLTRGPFPAGEANDDAVEMHLQGCHECRQLAEALRPAVAMFHESYAVQSPDLPAYCGALSVAEPIRVTESAARAIASAQPARRISPAWKLPLAGAAAICLMLFCVFSALQATRPSDPSPSAAKFQPNEQGMATLASLSLPANCLPTLPVSFVGADAINPVAATANACCTECHTTARSNRPPVEAVAKLMRSCSACHE